MIRHLTIAAGLCFWAAFPASAFSGRVPTFEKVASAGRTLKVASMSVIDQACQSVGPLTISLIEQPRSGRVEVEQGRDYPNFSALNTRSRCNARKAPATIVLYTPPLGYSGEDAFAIEFVGPYGNVGRARYHIEVR